MRAEMGGRIQMSKGEHHLWHSPIVVFVASALVVSAVAVVGSARPSLADPPPYSDVVGEDDPGRYWRLGEDPADGHPSWVYEEVTAAISADNSNAIQGEPGALLNPGDDENTALGFSPSSSSFVGASGYGVLEGTDDGGFELWLKTAEDFDEEVPVGSAGTLMSAGAGSSYGVNLAILGTGQIQASVWTFTEPGDYSTRTQQFATTAESWADGQWHHVVVNAGGNQLRVLVDGWTRAQTSTGSHVFFGFSAFGINIGGGFAGTIDEAVVYRAPIAEDRVQAHYTASGRSLPAEPIPDAQTNGSPCSSSEQAINPTAECADPVNTATGSYTQSVTDLALAMPQGLGAGEPFAWRRTYNSQDEMVGPLGRGWTFSYGVTLVEDAVSGDVTVKFGNGQQVLFRLQGDNSYEPGRGGLSSLEKVSSSPDTFDVTLHDQTVLRITDGLLTKITDTRLFETTLTYSSGKLATVVDPSARTVDVTWTGDRITEIQLPDGRDVIYGYENGLLHTVQDARNNTTTYEYADGLLTEVWDQRNHRITLNEYETDNLDANFGRVIHQTDAVGNVTDLSWDPATRTTTMTDPRGRGDGEDPEDYQWTYRYQGNLLMEQADPYDNTYEYRYDADGNRSSITTPRGKTWTLVYDNGNLIERDWPAPLSFVETWGYNDDNQVDSYTNANNHTTIYDYNERRQISLIDQPDEPPRV